MKAKMNKITSRSTRLVWLVVLCLGVAVSGCKKEGPIGPAGATGETGAAGAAGPDATTFNFNLTFGAGDTWASYGGITGFDAGDVLVSFILFETLGGDAYWTQMPVVISGVNFLPEFSDTDGYMFMNTIYADGSSGSPWTSATTLAFKVVLIKSSGLILHPDLDLSSYDDIQEVFDLD
jgi:hypothetical protein